MKQFFDVLFDKGELTCFSKDPYGTTVMPIMSVNWESSKFFSINPMQNKRADANVTSFRNILLEIDEGSLEQQRKYIEESGIPWSTCVYSGGKSYHYIISLYSSLANANEYRKVVRQIQKRLPMIDRAVGNPSRFSRVPGAMRGQVEQKLVSVGERVLLKDLLAWLGPEEAVNSEILKTTRLRRVLHPQTNYFLLQGAPPGAWNQTLFKSAADMLRASYTKEEIIIAITQITGYLDNSDLRTIESAVSTARRDLENLDIKKLEHENHPFLVRAKNETK